MAGPRWIGDLNNPNRDHSDPNWISVDGARAERQARIATQRAHRSKPSLTEFLRIAFKGKNNMFLLEDIQNMIVANGYEMDDRGLYHILTMLRDEGVLEFLDATDDSGNPSTIFRCR